MCRQLILLLGATSSAAALVSAVDVSVGAAFADHSTPDTFVSFNLDYHYDDEEWPSWRGCSVVNMSLTEPNLIFLASQLAPAVLRVGGSEGDLVFYETPGSSCPTNLPTNLTFCLNMTRWKAINDFASATGNKLAFGLNAMAGRSNGFPFKPVNNRSWDSTNTRAFLEYSKAAGITPYAFEFGNELAPFVGASQYAKDVLVLRDLINSIWTDPASRPKLVTNDANPDPSYLQALLSAAGDAIDVATWHLYIGYGLDPLLETHAWDATFMDKINATATGIVKAIDAANFKGEVWVGESAFAWHSGRVGVTDTFLSSPWWMSALGQLSPTHSGFCRQTLIGGNYELINKTTRAPNPDLYVARLWKDAMGPTVFAVTTNVSTLRAYAHCAPGGGLSLGYINFSPDTTAALVVHGASALGSDRLLRILSSADNTTVALNGVELSYEPGSGVFPSLAPQENSGDGAIAVPPHTVGFVTWPNAAGFNCA